MQRQCLPWICSQTQVGLAGQRGEVKLEEGNLSDFGITITRRSYVSRSTSSWKVEHRRTSEAITTSHGRSRSTSSRRSSGEEGSLLRCLHTPTGSRYELLSYYQHPYITKPLLIDINSTVNTAAQPKSAKIGSKRTIPTSTPSSTPKKRSPKTSAPSASTLKNAPNEMRRRRPQRPKPPSPAKQRSAQHQKLSSSG